MATAAITPRTSETALRPAILPGVRFIGISSPLWFGIADTRTAGERTNSRNGMQEGAQPLQRVVSSQSNYIERSRRLSIDYDRLRGVLGPELGGWWRFIFALWRHFDGFGEREWRMRIPSLCPLER